ncbi:MAG: SNARE associated Golgi protein [Chloroflexi bacterium ADurb.Bin360]|nr:MAG: SNARE associated Golgi protein [Chloroflexi bacterium ADurb.Bin360]
MENEQPPVRINIFKAVLGLLAAVGVTAAIFYFRTSIEQYKAVSYPAIFLISVLGNATVIFPAPSYAIAFSGGAVLNPYGVGVAAGLGAALGELTGYLIGSSGRVIAKSNLHARFEALITKWGWLTIFGLSLIPNPFFDIGGIVAGMMKMPVWKFLLATAAGKVIRFTVFGVLGKTLLGN